ncbi:MAG: hypothetical protein HYY78_09405 [Betaproteobacteria bacterium]|nr:hypothetical protein [Betaproteobacteria bacterium]
MPERHAIVKIRSGRGPALRCLCLVDVYAATGTGALILSFHVARKTADS